MASTSFSKHTDSPFKTVGILAPTGTPADQALYVPLAAIDAIHAGWQPGLQPKAKPRHSDHEHEHEHEHENLSGEVSLSAFMVGLKSKLATFTLQRSINNYPQEPLSAILPGVTLSQLWQLMAAMENTLRIISLLVLLAAEFGLAAMLLASIRERRNEITILRAIGAPAWFVLLIIQAEALIIACAGALLGILLLFGVLAMSSTYLTEQYGLFISANLLTHSTATLLAQIIASVFLVALIPGITAYRRASVGQF